MLRSIWTKHDNQWFRSRLEASWAEAFDAAGVRWNYEPMRFLLGNSLQYSYLPDFWLSNSLANDCGCYAEVKPVFPTNEEINLVKLLAEWTRLSVFFLVGKPWSPEIYEAWHNGTYCAWQMRTRAHILGV